MVFGLRREPDPDDGPVWLIVGLGNPGEKYAGTRHNAGFMVADLLAERAGTRIGRSECRSLIGRCGIGGSVAELVKPQTYMNLSGEAVNCLLAKREIGISNLLVLVDDLALPFGTIRLRRKGSSGGHNGLKSIIGCLGSDEFPRLRIGIAPDHQLGDAKRFVLDGFNRQERESLPSVLERSADAVEMTVAEGLDRAMGSYN